MTLQPDRQLLHYRLIDKLGEGGMGVVWRATDTTLGREVAIKTLPADFAADEERLARFDREARLLASLNHPNIASIYGIHQADGIHFLAMELIPGPDLAQRLEQGALPIDQALRIAREVATGLEVAHERGVIHRDLKPPNVKLTSDGTAKVLDFGLAKAADPAGSASGDPSHSPTITSAATIAGTILGTAAYMSPEQASGQPIDRRCDIWSFGVLLWELLTGKRLFDGETISHTLAAVLRDEIDFDALPAETPHEVRRLLERCLDRDPSRRLRDIGEARIALVDAIERPEATPETSTRDKTATGKSSWWPWLVAVAALAMLGMSLLMREAPPEPQAYRFSLPMPSYGGLRGGDAVMITISPDGRTIVTRGGAGTDDMLYRRDLDSFDPQPIPGTVGANTPLFSPDGEWISYLESDGLHKTRPGGGTSIRVGDISSVAVSFGYDWGSDGYFYYPNKGHLWRMPENGGEAERLTEEGALGNLVAMEPFVVPEAGVLLFNTRIAPQRPAQLMALDLETGAVRDLQRPGSDPTYLPTGHLLYLAQDHAVVSEFDVERLEFRGAPQPVLPRAALDVGNMQLAVSRNGTVAYIPRREDQGPALVSVGLEGVVEPLLTTGTDISGAVSDPRLSPSGDRLAVSINDDEIWVVDLGTETPTRLSEDGFYPVWSPDGTRLAFGSTRGESYDIYLAPVDLSSPESLLLDVDNNMRTMEWTTKGELVLREEIPGKGMDLVLWSDIGDESTLTSLMDGPDDELAPDISADGKWMAYVSNYSGTDEVYVTSFPTPGGRSRVSQQGGHSPAWSPDGKTLYYLEGMKMIALSVQTEPGLRVTARKTLFEGDYVQYRWSRQYDLAPDGKRFVMITNPAGNDVEVVTNWFEELRRMSGSHRN